MAAANRERVGKALDPTCRMGMPKWGANSREARLCGIIRWWLRMLGQQPVRHRLAMWRRPRPGLIFHTEICPIFA